MSNDSSSAPPGPPVAGAGRPADGSPETSTVTRRRRRKVIADEPLGSLAQTGSATMTVIVRCPVCGSDALTQVPLRAPSGERVTFVSCQECEHRTWVRADGSHGTREQLLGAPDSSTQPPPRTPRQYRPGR